MPYNKVIYNNSYLHACGHIDSVVIDYPASECCLDFSHVYLMFYSKLIRFAKGYVGVNEDAENIVQDVFLGLWERQGTMHLIENMNAYLFTLVKNKSLDYLKGKLFADKYNKMLQDAFEMEMNIEVRSLDKSYHPFASEYYMKELVNDAINSLPPKCREIFLSSRMDGLKYKEISNRFNISVNTVENQMSIALKKLRGKLRCLLTA